MTRHLIPALVAALLAVAAAYAVQTWRVDALRERTARQDRTIVALQEQAAQARQAAEVAQAYRDREAAQAERLRGLLSDIRNGGYDAPIPDDLLRLLDAGGVR